MHGSQTALQFLRALKAHRDAAARNQLGEDLRPYVTVTELQALARRIEEREVWKITSLDPVAQLLR